MVTPLKITYIGNATVLIESEHDTIITDPWFGSAPFGIKRARKPGLTASELPHIDIILISHEHFDHLDAKSLDLINKDAVVVAHRGLEKKIKRLGFREVTGLAVDETYSTLRSKITAVPASHSRYALGFVISSGRNIYFAGDTVFIPETFKRLGREFSIDIALLPIGGVTLFGFLKRVMDPADAAQAAFLINPRKVIPIHWGTFKSRSFLVSMTGTPEAFSAILKKARVSPEVLRLSEGEGVIL